ncbi:hypothetical protein RI367_006705 [Sorochytrium milnesiophthora]
MVTFTLFTATLAALMSLAYLQNTTMTENERVEQITRLKHQRFQWCNVAYNGTLLQECNRRTNNGDPFPARLEDPAVFSARMRKYCEGQCAQQQAQNVTTQSECQVKCESAPLNDANPVRLRSPTSPYLAIDGLVSFAMRVDASLGYTIAMAAGLSLLL